MCCAFTRVNPVFVVYCFRTPAGRGHCRDRPRLKQPQLNPTSTAANEPCCGPARRFGPECSFGDLAPFGASVALIHGIAQEAGQAVGEGTGLCSHIVCVERTSPVEIEPYFGVVAKWLVQNEGGETGLLPIRLVGTYDSRVPAMLGEHSSRLVALVHLDVQDDKGARGQRPEMTCVRHRGPPAVEV